MNSKAYDVIVIGGGASGLMSAVSCKLNNKALSVAVLEKNSKIGKKLLATGNGRCNLTNTRLSKENYQGSFNPVPVINRITPKKLISRFETLGLLCREEKGGLVYPYCKQASAVLEILVLQCQKYGVDIICGCTVSLIKKAGGIFKLRTEDGEFTAEKIIVCTGGKASPSCGGTGAGLDLLKNLGHTITPLFPALCPVETESNGFKSLKGVRATARVTLYDAEKPIKEETGELQFTENALSGICIFNLSSKVKDLDKPVIRVALMDEYSFEEISAYLLQNRTLFADISAEYLLTGILNKKIASYLFKEAGIDLSENCAKITEAEIRRLAGIINRLEFKCKKPCDFARAQVTAGGVSGSEVNPESLESRLVKNLYICGEALDINGDCGGYNLHFAFASGIIAGESI